jgi:hypothetical protein
MAVPYTFGSATTSIPLSQLDSNFATTITLGNTAVQLGNTITTLTGLTSVTTSGDSSISGLTVGKGGGSVANNTAVGNGALAGANTTGFCTSVGYQTLNVNTTAVANDAFGYVSLTANTTGSSNSGFGIETLKSNTTGSNNVAVGRQALNSNTTASNNTAVGYQAGYSNTTSGNTFIGGNAGYLNTSGANNAALGQSAGYNLTSGASNTLLGQNCGSGLTTGNNNVLVGVGAGTYTNTLTTGGQNVYVGVNASCSSASVTYEMVIATLNTTGKGSTTGFINPNGGGVYQGNNSGSWSQVSDQRLKKNIVDNTDGLEKISQLRVRNFEYRLPEEVTELDPSCAIPNKGVQLGVIAQEIQEVFPDCVKTESTGVISVDSDNLTWYMINAIKELKAEFDAYKATHP